MAGHNFAHGVVLAPLAMAATLAMAIAFTAPAHGKTVKAPGRCHREKVGDAKTAELRQAAQTSAIYAYAVAQLGKPAGCRVEWETYEGQDFGSIAYRFKDGSQLNYKRMPPEITVIELRSKRSLDLTKAQLTLEKEGGFPVDWTKPSETRTEGATVIKTFWHPEEGLNLGLDLVFQQGKLTGLGYHSAP